MSTVEIPSVRRGFAASTRHHTKRAVRRGAPELRTLVKFTFVGGSGFVVNLAVFTPLEHVGVHYLLAAIIAFCVAVVNNFHWNRRWTFNAVDINAIHRQAQRFLIVSVACALASLGTLDLLVNAGWPKVIAQAVALVLLTPVGFLGNRLWTFASPGAMTRLIARLRR